MSTAEQELRTAHAEYHHAWNEALATGDGQAAAAFLGTDLKGWFYNPGMEAPSTGDHDSYAESIRQAVGRLGRDARWSYDDPTVVMRGEDLGVIACITRLHRSGRADAKCTLSVWRREASGWRLHRTYEEVVGNPDLPNPELLAATSAGQQAWLDALKTGDAIPLVRLFSPDLQVVYCSSRGEPEVKDSGTYGTENLMAAAKIKGLPWSSRTLAAMQRSADEGVVLNHDIAGPAGKGHPLLAMEVWRRVEGEWRLVRLYQET